MWAHHDRCMRWVRRCARGWMVVGAIVFGMSTSSSWAMMMQPPGRATVPQSPRLPPSPPSSAGSNPLDRDIEPCIAFAADQATQQMVDELMRASQASTEDEALSQVPDALRDEIKMLAEAPARFHRALLGDVQALPQRVPVYVLATPPIAGEGQRALSSAAHGFTATFASADLLDLALAAQATGDPAMVPQPGESAWDVTGVGERNGVAQEFSGYVIGMPATSGMIYMLVVEDDAICVEGDPLTMGLTMGGQDPVPPAIPPGLPPVAWPELPRIDPGHPCWDYDCLRAKYKAYADAVANALRILAEAAKRARDAYIVVKTTVIIARTVQRIVQVISVMIQLRACLVLLVFGPWAAAACIAEVLITQLIIRLIVKYTAKLIISIARLTRDWFIRQATLAFQWAIYRAYNAIVQDIIDDCWTCEPTPEWRRPEFPGIPAPPWWPVDPNGPFKPN